MKSMFSLSGVLLGLLAALLVGLTTSHWIGWLPVGLIVGVAAVVSLTARQQPAERH